MLLPLSVNGMGLVEVEVGVEGLRPGRSPPVAAVAGREMRCTCSVPSSDPSQLKGPSRPSCGTSSTPQAPLACHLVRGTPINHGQVGTKLGP